MNIFRIITCIFFSYFFAFINDGFSQCEVTISNTQCRLVGIYNEADDLLTTMSRGPMSNSPTGTPTPTWTDPNPLADNETRTYFLKEGNFVLTTKTVTCEDNEITTSNPYPDACQDGLGQGVYINTGCRTLNMERTNGSLVASLAPNDTLIRQATNIIYIFLVGNDTIDITSTEGVFNINSGGCEELNPCKIDSLPPICIAPADVTMTCDSLNLFLIDDGYESDFAKRIAYFGAATVVDSCNAEVIELPFDFYFSTCYLTPLVRRFIAIDENGNQSKDTCVQTIYPDRANSAFFIKFPDLNEPYIPTNNDVEYTSLGCHAFIQSGSSIYVENERGDTIDVSTNYLAVNWCGPELTAPDSTLQEYAIPPLDLNNDSIFGDGFIARGLGDSVYISRPNLPDLVYPFTVLNYSFTERYQLKGNVYADVIENCEKDTMENGLQGFTIKVRSLPSGSIQKITSRFNGNYNSFLTFFSQDTLLEVSIESSLNLGKSCLAAYTLPIPTESTTFNLDFPVQLNPNCPLLTVDIGTSRLRRCFSNNFLAVNYCNYSLLTVKNAEINVQLDPFLIYQPNDENVISNGNNNYTFIIDSIQPGECNRFAVEVEVSCEAVLGQTHCVMATIAPSQICDAINGNWSGASIQVDANCDGDSVRLKIENIGDGNMIEEHNFVVTEDVLMLRQGTFQLATNELLELTYPANGATYRIAAEQVIHHPGISNPSISLEGCGGINTTGLVNAFPQDDGNIFESIECIENIGSYDPNDKSASPSGWGNENYLAKNTDLEYLIRFQNTGTDTAFTVVIKDTLSQFLDATTVLPGVASHHYTFQQFFDSTLNISTIQFTFNNILLPDSTTNLEESNGFVKFKIAQQPDLIDGIILENKAAIFFDFNEPIITNIVFHTIGQPFGRIISSTKELRLSNREVVVQPNPFKEQTLISITGQPIKNGKFLLYNAVGKMASQQSFSGNEVIVFRKDLPDGLYFYQLVADQQLIKIGKIQMNGQ